MNGANSRLCPVNGMTCRNYACRNFGCMRVGDTTGEDIPPPGAMQKTTLEQKEDKLP